ncbi:MAG: AAA family ATPase [Candidatus Thiodiazotropha sp. LLP2]
MKIRHIEIENFRAIKSIKLHNLEDTVVIAGPNGCGKSCIFDAIRLLKSVYGGYEENEWKQWFGEFQIDIQTLKEDVTRILNDNSKPLRIAVSFEFSEEEKEYFRNHGQSLIEQSIWHSIFPKIHGPATGSGDVPIAQQRHHRPNVDARTKSSTSDLIKDLENDLFWGELNVSISGKLSISPCPLLEVCFSSYDPENIGLIDYHGANRAYNREQFANVNLDIKTTDQKMRSHALYNSASKYGNVKSEMAGAYIRELIAKDAAVDLNNRRNIIDTLKELFEIFFPGKTFLGPQPTPDGKLSFPVKLQDGSSHDINELSSGEKEVLYGYLRIQNTSPQNSILLLDEPELHLNPRLIRGLPKFYQKYLGIENNNQIWLVTHSDAFLRETVGEPDFSVFHMRPPLQTHENGKQIIRIDATSRLEAAIIDLVGDLASYSPNSKIVIFEGGGDSDFDLKMVSTLFPELTENVNVISGENKSKVRQLHGLLDKASSEGVLPYEFFSIVDWDTEPKSNEDTHQLQWDVYHIENYLLHPHYISVVINDLKMQTDRINVAHAEALMKSSAEKCIPKLVAHELTKHINTMLVSCIDLSIDPTSNRPDSLLVEAIMRSRDRIDKAIDENLTTSNIKEKKSDIEENLKNDIDTNKWIKTFRGRDILKSLLTPAGLDVNYVTFRNLIISRMRDDGHRPEGMAKIINQLLSTNN